MRTKDDIFKDDVYSPQLVNNGEVFFRWRHVQGMMDEWAKQTALALFEEMEAAFDKKERELWDKLTPQMKQSFTFKLHGETPIPSEVIDKWYEQYTEKLQTKTPV